MTKDSAFIDKRIAWLGDMDDRRHIAMAENNLGDLEDIAKEYAERGLTTTAQEVRIVISLRKNVTHETLQPTPSQDQTAWLPARTRETREGATAE